MNPPFVGPSYDVFDGRASRSRSVNLYLSAMETPAKAQFVMASVPGLTPFASLGETIRGALATDDRCFVVAGDTLFELSIAGAATERGTLQTNVGNVSMAWGRTQLVIVDGPNCYTLRLSNNAFARVTDPDFPGARTVDFVNGYFTFVRPSSQQAFVSSIDDASEFDALDFVEAERVPDGLVGQVCIFGEWWMLGRKTTEVWSAVPSTGFPFQRNSGANSDVGCIAPFTAQKIDNGAMMLGRDQNGSGMVFRSSGLQWQRVSTQAIEQSIADGDKENASAYVYQQRGLTFYCLNVPGVSTQWCYEVSTGTWHERCDLDANGQFKQGRVTHHVFAFEKNLACDADGEVYEIDPDAYTNGGDPLIRERISPNSVTPTRELVSYGQFVLDCTTGKAPQGEEYFAELSWSDDGGQTFGNPDLSSLGKVGEFSPRVTWEILGAARDRVWKLRFGGPVPFTIVNAEAV